MRSPLSPLPCLTALALRDQGFSLTPDQWTTAQGADAGAPLTPQSALTCSFRFETYRGGQGRGKPQSEWPHQSSDVDSPRVNTGLHFSTSAFTLAHLASILFRSH